MFSYALRHSLFLLLLLLLLLLQACKAAASAFELVTSSPDDYTSSAAYCHWQLQHVAALLSSHLQLGFKPPQLLLMGLMPALMLHMTEDAESSNIQQQLQQQPPRQQQQRQQHALEVLEVLATLSHHPGRQVGLGGSGCPRRGVEYWREIITCYMLLSWWFG
jgi:hypothetical protein